MKQWERRHKKLESLSNPHPPWGVCACPIAKALQAQAVANHELRLAEAHWERIKWSVP